MGFFDKPIPVPEAVKPWFEPYPHVYVDNNLGGMRVRPEGVALGMRAGPAVGADMLFHEMAHLIETSDDRVCQYNWGMTYPMVEVLGRVVAEPMTAQGCHREIRTWGIQEVIARTFGFEPEEHGSELRWLADECHFRVDLGLLGEDNEESMKLGYAESHALTQDIARAMISMEASKWSPERVEAEWHRKCRLIEASYARGDMEFAYER